MGARKPVCVAACQAPESPRGGPEPKFPRGASCQGVLGPGSPGTRLGCQPLLRAIKEAFLAGPHGSLRQEPPGLG